MLYRDFYGSSGLRDQQDSPVLFPKFLEPPEGRGGADRRHVLATRGSVLHGADGTRPAAPVLYGPAVLRVKARENGFHLGIEDVFFSMFFSSSSSTSMDSWGRSPTMFWRRATLRSRQGRWASRRDWPTVRCEPLRPLGVRGDMRRGCRRLPGQTGGFRRWLGLGIGVEVVLVDGRVLVPDFRPWGMTRVRPSARRA